MSGPDVDALVAEALDAMDAGGDFAYEPVGVAGRSAVRSLAALARSAAEMESKLEDIATREWRDEGGRIAAAIARDSLAARSREQQEPQA